MKSKAKSRSKTLHLHVTRQWFDLIKAGKKKTELRLVNGYWKERLLGRTYELINIYCGYPPRDDESLFLTFPYKGFEMLCGVTFPEHFGPDPVDLFSIKLDAE